MIRFSNLKVGELFKLKGQNNIYMKIRNHRDNSDINCQSYVVIKASKEAYGFEGCVYGMDTQARSDYNPLVKRVGYKTIIKS